MAYRAFLPLLFVPLVVPLSPYFTTLGTNPSSSQAENITPSTTQSVLMTLSHLHALNAMLPPTTMDPAHISWLKSWKDMERHRLVRGGITIWIMWIGLNLVLGGRAVSLLTCVECVEDRIAHHDETTFQTLALIGSACILASSPATKSMYTVLGQSLLLRRTAALAFLLVFGSPPAPSTAVSSHPEDISSTSTWVPIKSWIQGKWRTSRRPSFAFRLRAEDVAALRKEEMEPVTLTAKEDLKVETSSASAPLYFRFELQENQRWWMGLDWTSALLPQERPSWCDAYLNPSSPPSGFTLPSDSTMFLPEPKKGDPNGRTKRISRWRWLDEDWSVIKRLGTSGASHPPTTSGVTPASGTHHARSSSVSAGDAVAPNSGSVEEPKKGLAEQAFVKGLERLKARTMTGSSGPPASPSSRRPISGDYGEGSSPGGSHDKLAGRGSFDSDRRKSSAASDLAGPLSVHATSASGHGSGVTAAPMGAGSASNASGSLSLLADLDVGTDGDGWSYGDNKWENMGPRGGLGRVSWAASARIPIEVIILIERSNDLVYEAKTMATFGSLYGRGHLYPRIVFDGSLDIIARD